MRRTRFSAGTASRSPGSRSTSTSRAISAGARPRGDAGQKCRRAAEQGSAYPARRAAGPPSAAV
ncbi:hypothetical protein AB0P12_06185 [Streptomyces subrutilus]|uniref:hypothetical protein n=1 Tax=Streptomyces subrutilus TaxID=36818 RepID=UPI0034405E2D